MPMTIWLLRGRADSGVWVVVQWSLGLLSCPSCVSPLCLSPGHRPHVPPEVSLPPRDQPPVHQAEDAAARVHHQALRGEGDLPGVLGWDAQLGFGGLKRRFMGLILPEVLMGSPGGLARTPPSQPGSPSPRHQAPHSEVLIFTRFTSFWTKTMTRSVRMCWTCSSAAGPR